MLVVVDVDDDEPAEGTVPVVDVDIPGVVPVVDDDMPGDIVSVVVVPIVDVPVVDPAVGSTVRADVPVIVSVERDVPIVESVVVLVAVGAFVARRVLVRFVVRLSRVGVADDSVVDTVEFVVVVAGGAVCADAATGSATSAAVARIRCFIDRLPKEFAPRSDNARRPDMAGERRYRRRPMKLG